MRCNRRRRPGFATALAASLVLFVPHRASLTWAGDEPIASTNLAAEVLSVAKGPVADEVILSWSGGSSPWDVFRSTDPTSVTAPASRLGTTTTSSWTDSPPTEQSLVFYEVGSCGTPATPAPHGCSTCDICDAWDLSWAPVPCADHYVVRWKCTLQPEQAWSVAGTSVGDICFDIGMCDQCGAGVVYIHVEACGASGCSPAGSVPAGEIPRLCGGGCCVP